MMPARIVIVDDDAYTRLTLIRQLSRFDDTIKLLADFEDPHKAIPYIREHTPDLLLLDIRMPGLTGFDLLDALDVENMEVVFITSYDEYAIRAIKYSALDYLLKPVSDKDISEVLIRYWNKSRKGIHQAQLESLRHNLSISDVAERAIVVHQRGGSMVLPVARISRLEAESNYTWLYLLDNTKLLASKTLKEYEAILDESEFIRPNRSQIVNIRHVKGWTMRGSMYLELQDHTEVLVSRRRTAEISEKLKVKSEK